MKAKKNITPETNNKAEADKKKEEEKKVEENKTEGKEKSKDAGRETVWTLAGRRADGLHTLNLINLYGVDTLWRNACANPVPQTGLALKIHVVGPARRVWLATPDDGLGRPRELPFQSGTDETGAFITLAVPLLEFWNLIWIEPAAPPAE